ncbi:hypothetical protein C4D60_Mb03t13140 [Musa balbisiana]|uniref:Uncharacterized protein n=1 Tax=Musa balbisiana TaxID=52838 RepID=A0A4V4H629_MUSBA|nr:hypothetical protein C4D60_Mb03t13140 [Musa balbisiana]
MIENTRGPPIAVISREILKFITALIPILNDVVPKQNTMYARTSSTTTNPVTFPRHNGQALGRGEARAPRFMSRRSLEPRRRVVWVSARVKPGNRTSVLRLRLASLGRAPWAFLDLDAFNA